MRTSRHACALVSGAVIVFAAACHDVPTKPRLQSPLVGLWEVTTHFDTFTFETPAPAPPDCPYMGSQYCVHYRSETAGAYLGGTLEMRDTSSSTDTVSKSVIVTGTLQSSFCDSIDLVGLTGCAHSNAPVAIQYKGNIGGMPDSTTVGSISFWISEPPVGSWPNPRNVHSATKLTYAGDSIYGPVYWGTMTGRSPPSYRGTIVLHRVH